jgi:hypothetical protein
MPKITPNVIALSVALAVVACSSAPTDDLTVAELANVLGVKAWRLPEPEVGREWVIDVQNEAPVPEPRRTISMGSRVRTASASLRPIDDSQYAFTLRQRRAEGSGTIKPCAEPEGSESLCEGYSIEFFEDPPCLPGCAAYVVAAIKPMLGTAGGKQIILQKVQSLAIPPSKDTVVIPQRR